MHKRIKFSQPLSSLIVKGKKDVTWRINDDKAIVPGDLLSLCRDDGTEFAKAEVIWVKETRFKHLTEEDMHGHEEYQSEKQLYNTYSDTLCKLSPRHCLK